MILWLAGWRYLLRHPLQIVFAVVGVALGVAVVIAIDLANSSAERAFRQSAETLSGSATHQLVGGSGGVDETLYRQLRLAGWRPAAPVIEGFAAFPARPGTTLQILGVDPLAEGPFRNYSPRAGDGTQLGRLLTEPGACLMSPQTAASLALQTNDSFELEIGGELRRLTLVGLLQPRSQVAARGLDQLLVTDIATAQELLAMHGRISRIDLILPEGETGLAARDRLQSLLPAGTRIIPAGTRGEIMAQMTRAFQLNLTALSLLALVVGMFLIYNTMTFSVLQRRPLLGALRTLGVTRREIFALVLAEALAVGMVGTLLGLLLGTLLAEGLLALVTRTINDLYFVVSVRQLSFSAASLGKGLLLGLGATAAAALAPAIEAAGAPPRNVLSRSVLESRRRRLLPWALALGATLLAAGLLGMAVPSKSVPGSFLLLFTAITGYALLTPAAAAGLLRLAQPLLKRTFGVLGKMAARNLVAGLSRTGVASAALVIAVAATVGVGIMIGSFRVTVEQWLQSYLRADIYLTTASASFGPGRTPLNPELIARVAELPGIERLTRARHLNLETEQGFSELFSAEIPAESFAGYWFAEGDREAIYQAFQHQDAVIVSEPFAYHRGLRRGDRLRLPTDRGEREFAIAGVFTDYGSDQGRITMSRRLYEKYWDDRGVDALGIYLAPGTDAEQLVGRLRAASADLQQVVVYSNRGLREASLATFDRTFAVTAVLRTLAVLVAFVGILNALMAMQIERSRELAVLRAGGLTPRQLWGLVIGETGLIGLVAGVLALPLGVIQALVLILVINRRSFGWTMQTHLDPAVLLQAVALALAAALLAGLYPAWRMARTAPALALREE
ncbi:ABC transporter permease [Desulfuromonas versatilis]|uniref:ABC transporter permease n=1 Tax=Desulfuromonas versatilis TaxID=2802975 RepID=A0ABN6DTM1_9BACT|nr:ABC transporter permease [Desulfuromonas versatilis]BCR03478.1 ABC transporter permease [Desulfuromonas versatilis]